MADRQHSNVLPNMGFWELVLAYHDANEASVDKSTLILGPKPIIAILFFGMTIELYFEPCWSQHYHLPVCLSRAWENWLIGGGTFNLVWRTAFCLWRRMYFGQRTNRLKSLLGWMSWPIPKLRGRFSNNGLTTLFCSGFLTARGAAATFFPFFLPWNVI